MTYDVVVVGGVPRTSTALYTTSFGHRTALFEHEGGRHATFGHVHSLPDVSENVSGRELADHALEQLETYGGDVHFDSVESIDGPAEGSYPFRVEADHAMVEARRIVLATGFRNHGTDVPGLVRFTGRRLYYLSSL
ncbi:hypothetical protein OB919_13235 [Halobacteria archaeon AArc-curdl1]|uniref:Thioredoxin reductase n=1 Tax=Natronosalvus hydrolyticus TaxID=2979988 RepID=A0AAP2Z9N1_9EURY|nr:hypothetical protein [Halobacteria archaeon AArc-curdl1]